MYYGVCADPKFAPVLAEAGFGFLELNVQGHLMPERDDATFLPELARIQASPIPALVANCFIPGHLKITGPDVDMAALERYVTVAFQRAQRAGIPTIVFGSGGARRIPEGFDREAAWQQLVAFGKMFAPLAQRYDVTVVVEPLNKRECNVLNAVGESARYVEAVAHSNLRLLVDAYHWYLDQDRYDDLVAYGHLLRHVHIATSPSRSVPGFDACDFSDFFRALKAGGYDGAISIEAKWENMEDQADKAYVTLRELVETAGM